MFFRKTKDIIKELIVATLFFFDKENVFEVFSLKTSYILLLGRGQRKLYTKPEVI